MSKVIENKDSWYASWFDTPWYHILYKNRSEDEAYAFIDKLIAFLQPNENASMLDHACGNGRHARRLAKLGYEVTGLDLSASNIMLANQHPLPNLHFDIHDMRLNYKPSEFDYIFNFFTSFGYFEDESDNQLVMNAVHYGLKAGGKFVIDFMNSFKTASNLIPKESKNIDGITFNITRTFTGTHIVKEIDFVAGQQNLHFEERVRTLSRADFERYFQHADLELQNCFGNYSLDSFDPEISDRLILIAGKTG